MNYKFVANKVIIKLLHKLNSVVTIKIKYKKSPTKPKNSSLGVDVIKTKDK